MSEPMVLSNQEECLSLHTIPVEIFLHICKFLDGKQILDSLKFVCQRFHDILSDDSVWRAWMKERWSELPSSNICYKDFDIPSPLVCIQVDRGLSLWSTDQKKIKKYIDNWTHNSTVDTVKLIQGSGVGVSGARDRSLAVWSTRDELCLLEQKTSAHDGWIWALETCPQLRHLYSGSWDSSVKLWSLGEAGLQHLNTFKSKAAVLSLVCAPGLVGAGLFTSSVELFDPRSGLITAYTAHHRSIMALCKVRNFIVSASEDTSIALYDTVAGKIFKQGIQISRLGYPMTLSFSDGNLLFIGDSKSMLHIYDTNNDVFEHIESFDLGHKPRGTITSMWHNPGVIMTGSKDSTVRIHTVTRPPHLINQLTSTNEGVAALDFADPVLFLGCVSNAVEMWVPS